MKTQLTWKSDYLVFGYELAENPIQFIVYAIYALIDHLIFQMLDDNCELCLLMENSQVG